MDGGDQRVAPSTAVMPARMLRLEIFNLVPEIEVVNER
jgi:hypothetical protein